MEVREQMMATLIEMGGAGGEVEDEEGAMSVAAVINPNNPSALDMIVAEEVASPTLTSDKKRVKEMATKLLAAMQQKRPPPSRNRRSSPPPLE